MKVEITQGMGLELVKDSDVTETGHGFFARDGCPLAIFKWRFQ
jgi:hypothetical protein